MYNMWRLMVVDSLGSNQTRLVNYTSLTLRTLFCLLFLLLIIITLTVAGVYQQLTNICVAILFVAALFFIIYSLVVKILFRRQESIQASMNQRIWTINNASDVSYDEWFKDPPSYESVITDPKYVCPCCQRDPPPYTSVLMNFAKSNIAQTTNEVGSNSVILQASRLNVCHRNS